MSVSVRLERPPASLSPAPRRLQRACPACKVAAKAESECETRGGTLMRHAAIASPSADVAPPIVHEVLRGPGSPLDGGVRTTMEQRFGHDFSGVRVHSDARAAASARVVSADAYTVGSDIVFAAGKGPGAAASGLLAHELAHVVQQSGAPTSGPLRVAPATDPAEREADSAARRAMTGRAEPVAERRASGLFRQEAPDAGVADAGVAGAPRGSGMGDLRLAEQRAADEQELSDQQSAEEQARAKETGPVNMQGRMLTRQDIDTATKAVQGAASPAQISPRISGARFVLHDTAVQRTKEKDEARIREHVGFGRRSSGEGAAAWIMPDGTATISHDPLFGRQRPTATKWERGEDQMGEETIWSSCRTVWNATKADKREQALSDVVSSQGSVGKEAKDELALAHKELKETSGKVHTAATWAAEVICGAVTPASVAGIAAKPESEAILTATCKTLNDLFKTRNERIARTMNVEMVKPKGSQYQTKDEPTGKRIKFPPYPREVYDSVRDLYVKAALRARLFPEITTHREVDEKIGSGGHGDPRCFNLTCLYEEIAAIFGHASGTSYGIPIGADTYGTRDTSDIWWDPWVCDAPAPSAGSCPKPTPPKPAETKAPADEAPKKAPAKKKPK